MQIRCSVTQVLIFQPEVSNGDTTASVEAPPSAPVPQDDLTANEHGLNFLGESEVSSRSRIHADAPPFYPSSTTHVTQPPPTSSFDSDFAPAEASSGWDEPSKYCVLILTISSFFWRTGISIELD